MRFSEFSIARRSDCAVCGAAPTITEPRDPAAVRAPAVPGLRRLSAGALRELLSANAGAPLLVDVREVPEFSAGHLQGSVNIPLGELPQRLHEIAPGAAPVFICRSGGRSLAACQLALRANVASPANLEGGLLAWAAEIDPELFVL
jgi:sulfur-carrier protein adenylyltransferase/sulfurtransferase